MYGLHGNGFKLSDFIFCIRSLRIRVLRRAAVEGHLSVTCKRCTLCCYCSTWNQHWQGGSAILSVEGIVSTLGLVLAMLEVGVFKTLRFDPSRMRIEKRGNTASQQLQPARAPPWAEAQIETRAAVTFSSCIELEHLIIPICLDHGSRNMKYVSQVDPRSEIDFHALRNLSSDSHEFGATGASAHCRLCNKSLGNVSLRQGSTPSAGSKLGFGLFDLGGLSPGTLTTLLRDGALPTFMTRPKQDQGTPKSSGVLRSALKGGGAVGRKRKLWTVRMWSVQPSMVMSK